MGLGCWYKALLMPLESKSCPAFLLYIQVPGTQPGSPGFCLQLSFRPPSKLLFYTALPGTPTVPKLSPHYSTVYKRDLIFMPEYQLLGPLPLCKACAGTGSHAAANLGDWHCIEAAQTNSKLTSMLKAGAHKHKAQKFSQSSSSLRTVQHHIITNQFFRAQCETAQ